MVDRILVITAVVCLGLLLVTPASAQDAFGSSTDVKLANVRGLIEAKDYTAAERVALEVTEEMPTLLDGWKMLGYTRSLTGKFELSNEAYDTALDLGGDRGEIFLLKAYNCRQLGDAESARDCYRSILESDQDNVDVLMQFGAYESYTENYQSAVTCFEEVLRLTPDNADAYDAIARAEEKLGDASKVKYWLETGLGHHPDDPRLLKRLATAYLNEQSYRMAIHYLDKLIEVDPNDAGAYRNRGVAYYQQGAKKAAREDLEQMRALDGKMKGLYGPLADCYRATKRPSDALSVIKEGLDAGEQKAWLYSIWGKLLEDSRQYQAAISKFNQAVALRDEPWSGYARKQIDRQHQHIKRAEMLAAQGAMD